MATTTVTATYLDPSGNPCKGRVVFRLVAATYQDGLDAIFPTVPVSDTLNASGQISVELEPTSGVDAALDATDMTYQVWERINGTDRAPYYVDIPTAPSVDLGTLATYDDPPLFVRELVTPDLSTLGYLTTSAAATTYAKKTWIDVTDPAYGATGDGTTNDTTAILAAVAACPTGGTVFFPTGTYKMTSTLSITKALTLRGAGVSAKYGGINASNTGQAPSASPWLEGSVIRQDTAATTAVTINVKGVQVDVRDLGVKFGDAIAFQNTGHGFKVYSSETQSGGGESSVYDGRWDNVKVWGHDGNHYAYWLNNANYCNLSHLVSFGGGGINLSTDSTVSPTGNHLVLQPWICMFVRGTADAMHLESANATHHGNGNLNLITFIRPQLNVIDITGSPSQVLGGFLAPANQHGWFHVNDPAGIEIYDLDMEIGAPLVGMTNDIGGYTGSGTTVHNAIVYSRQFEGGYQRGLTWLKGDQRWNAKQMDAQPGRSQLFCIPHATSAAASVSNHYQQYGMIDLPTSTVTGVLFEVTTLGASSSVRLGLYEDDDGLPGDLFADWGSVAATSTGYKELAVSTSVYPGGRFWLSAVPQGATSCSLRVSTPLCTGGLTSISELFGLNYPRCYYNTAGGVTGALPATAPSAANLSGMPTMIKLAVRLG